MALTARTLSTREIAQGLRDAGFPEGLIPTMTAVTLAESSGNPYAHNPNRTTGDNSYGLLQINMIDGMGPERRAEFGIASNDALFDPATNFRAAKKIFDQQGIGAWGAYTNGSYKQFMGADIGSADVDIPRASRSGGSPTTGLDPNGAGSDVPDNLPLANKVALSGLDIDMAKALQESSEGRMAGAKVPGLLEGSQQQLGNEPVDSVAGRDRGVFQLLGLLS